ncbi:MAG: hypothetical protein IT429_10220 [Gemmataceae bacterium]|nr:hypothetical protein [Gemmataceae bacterium]
MTRPALRFGRADRGGFWHVAAPRTAAAAAAVESPALPLSYEPNNVGGRVLAVLGRPRPLTRLILPPGRRDFYPSGRRGTYRPDAGSLQ